MCLLQETVSRRRQCTCVPHPRTLRPLTLHPACCVCLQSVIYKGALSNKLGVALSTTKCYTNKKVFPNSSWEVLQGGEASGESVSVSSFYKGLRFFIL